MEGPPSPGTDAPGDAAWLDLRLAELLRVAGRTEEALARLDAGTSGLRSAPLAGWNWLRAAARMPGLVWAEHPAAAALVDHRRHPLLAAAQALALAARRLDCGGPVDALLDDAEDWLEQATPRKTRWHAQLADLSPVRGRASRLARRGPPDDAGGHGHPA